MAAIASTHEQSPSMAVDGDARREATTSFLSRIKDSRVAIERVWPEFDGGRFAVKRAMGDTLVVEADIFCDAARG